MKSPAILGFLFAVAFYSFLIRLIVKAVKKRKKARQEKLNPTPEPEPEPAAAPAPRFVIPVPSGACEKGHQFTEAYGGWYIHNTPYLPMHLRGCATKRCRICGCREKPLLGPEDLPKGSVPKELKEKLHRFGRIRGMSQEALERLIRDTGEDLDYRIYAAECMTDEARILELLKGAYLEDPNANESAVWTRLVWQLPADPDGGLFESIAADTSYPIKARELAITRILDLDALDRLAADPDLAKACQTQRPEAICREGHIWTVTETKIVSHDSYRMNSPYWVVDKLRCARCGKTRESEMYCRLTSPYARDDDDD